MSVVEPVLRVEDLTIRFVDRRSDLTAVRNLSFSVGRGETLAIVGESGCGKSITALSLLGLVPKPGRVEGRGIHLEGTDILKLRGEWTQACGRPVLPMTHPAYLLRNPAAKREAWADLLTIAARLEGA